uniref:Uncharacterized protein n=1 Tax=Panagrolaimus sp. PS1159 TaxID=55785 RepID=A0AC35GVY8_9BILA
MEEVDKHKTSNLISLDEKTLTAIQLLKDVRKELAQYRKQEGDESSSSNAAEINAYKAVEEVLPRMVITPMLTAQIERHRDKVAFSAKESELMKKVDFLRQEMKEMLLEISKTNAENKKVKAELADAQYIIKGLDKLPDGINPSFRQIIETKARRIVQLEGNIKEITKEKEAMAEEIAQLKKLLSRAKTPSELQGKELMEFEALLDEPDVINDDPSAMSPIFEATSPGSEGHNASTRKRLWQELSQNQEILDNQIHHQNDNNAKKGLIEARLSEKQNENGENQTKTVEAEIHTM